MGPYQSDFQQKNTTHNGATTNNNFIKLLLYIRHYLVTKSIFKKWPYPVRLKTNGVIAKRPTSLLLNSSGLEENTEETDLETLRAADDRF